MFAQLGNYVFDLAKTFGEYSEQASANYTEHNLLDGKPRLQRTGSSLNEVSIKAVFHNSFCVPQDEFNNLKTSRDNGEILPLLWGNGLVEGDFVITEISATREDVAPNGTIVSISLSLSLKEYVSPNKLNDEQQANKSKAKAVGNKKPVAKKKINPSTCPQIISGIVSKINNHFLQINAIILEAGGMVTLEHKNQVLGHLKAMRALSDDLIKRGSDPNSCAYPFPDIKYRAQQIQNAVDAWNNDVSNKGAVPTQAVNNKIMAACVRNLRTAAQPLISQAMVRKN